MFGEILKNLMISSGTTQQKLADNIGYAQRTVSSWINNQSEPTEKAIVKCATFFEVTTDYLLGLEDDFGARIPAAPPAPMGDVYSSEERKLIDNYRELSASGKRLVNETIKTLLATSGGSEQNKA